MFSPDQYRLIDFGAGRKLERFGELVLDRPCQVAAGPKECDEQIWRAALRFERHDDQPGAWVNDDHAPPKWSVKHDAATFELKRSDVGHVGLFPEQAENWAWLSRQVKNSTEPDFFALNLFAYTGGSTMACAAAGAHVAHVDAAGNTVKWARRNAALSGLDDAPIRWLVDDAGQFVRREIRRRRIYHGIVLDPPSFGRGPRGQVWELKKDFPWLLRDCATLAGDKLRFALITCHSTGFSSDELLRLALECWPAFRDKPPASGMLTLTAADGRQLPSGVYLRWSKDD